MGSLTRPLTRSLTGPLTRAITDASAGGVLPIDPATLFTGGELGQWHDYNDLTTLFQDVGGTIPVTAAGQTVARVLDKSGRGNHSTITNGVLQVDGDGRYYLVASGTTLVSCTTISLNSNMDSFVAMYRDAGEAPTVCAYSSGTIFIGALQAGSALASHNNSGTPSYVVDGIPVAGPTTRNDLFISMPEAEFHVFEAVGVNMGGWVSRYLLGALAGFPLTGRIYETVLRQSMTAPQRAGLRLYLSEGSSVTAPLSGEAVFFNNYGQSLGEGSNGVLTTTQEYGNVGFAARVDSPFAYVTLTVANTQYLSRGESPMYGALGNLGALTVGANTKRIACNNAISGATIETLAQATAPYIKVLSQVRAAFGLSGRERRSFRAGATFFTQGEANNADAVVDYRDKLIALAAALDTDTRAITSQSAPHLFITYQTATGTGRNAALAQLAAHEASSLIYMACPMYQFAYYDTQHIDGPSSKWLGGYYGLAYKRIAVDGLAWEPTKPVSHSVAGAVIDLVLNVPTSPLVIDTTAIPAQTDYGFTLVDAADAPLTISSVALLNATTVRITAASPVPAGAKLRYGFNSATGKGTFAGGCGNLRDSQGDTVTYEGNAMHNWCVIFERTVA